MIRLGLLALLLPMGALAQDRVICQIDGCITAEIDPDDRRPEFSYMEIWDVVGEIMDVTGLLPNFQLVSSREVDNAAAMIIDDIRYIAYNPDWLRRYQDDDEARWILYAVMAHEIGHHLQGHTLLPGGSRPPTELEADEYAGFILAGLGATEDQALALWRSFSRSGSNTHPPRAARLDAVRRGYERFVGRAQGTVARRTEPTVVTPPPTEPQELPDTPASDTGGDKGRPTAPPPVVVTHSERPRAPGEICADFAFDALTQETITANACVDSELAMGVERFPIDNLFDADSDTAWVEGGLGAGIGSAISWGFTAPRAVTGIALVNGLARSDAEFAENGRIRTLRLTGSNGATVTLDLEDTADQQEIASEAFPEVTWIRAEVTAIYPGTRFADLAVSEWRFALD